MLSNKTYQISIAGIIIDVTRKRIKNLRLLVYPPDGRVKITAPLHVKENEIHLFVITKLEWIKKHQNKYLNRTRAAEHKFISGEQHYLFGVPFLLWVVEHNKPPKVNLCGERIDLFVKPGSTKVQREKILEAWYRKELKEKAQPLIARWENIAGVMISDFGIKKMKTRWGSCNIRTKKIWLNIELAKRPMNCLEFIILHELVHLLERNHNARFKAYMDKFMPEWRTYNKELKN